MKHFLLPALAFAIGAAFLPTSADARGGSTIKVRSRLLVAVDLFPTAAGTVESTGEVQIKVKQKDAVQKAKLELSVDGLPAGTYTLSATPTGGTSQEIVTFAFDGTVIAGAETDEDESTLELTFPSELDARAIESVAVSNADGVVVLEGAPDVTVVRERYFANVKVTGSGTGKKVHGHALLIAKTDDAEELDRKVLFIGFGAAPDAVLTINVNGEAVGSVTSSKQGRVKFQELDAAAEIPLSSIESITLTDAEGTVVMQALF